MAIWNSLPGVTPVKKFKDRTTAATRIWKNIQDLGEATKPKAAEQPKGERKAKGGAQSAKGAPASGMHSRLISGLPPASEQQPENED